MQAKRIFKFSYLAILGFLTLFFRAEGTIHRWDQEYWQYLTFRNWENQRFALSTTCEIRFHKGMSRHYYSRVTENFAYKAAPYVILGFNYSYLRQAPEDNPIFTARHRFEFEINPHLQLKNGMMVRWRNRLEVIKREDLPKTQKIFRHRILFSFPIKGYGWLKSLNLHDEIFYEYNIDKFIQNRFVPLELVFETSKKIDFRAFFMLRNSYSIGEAHWLKTFVLGTEIIY